MTTRNERNYRHGHARAGDQSKEYSTWNNMLTRCNNPIHNRYHRYGGRGITVCERWVSFKMFYEDMGPKPEGMTLERIDNEKGYSKENCRWATTAEQSNNKSTCVYFTHNGKTQTKKMWCDELGIRYATVMGRQRIGWSLEKALFTPEKRHVNPRGKKVFA